MKLVFCNWRFCRSRMTGLATIHKNLPDPRFIFKVLFIKIIGVTLLVLRSFIKPVKIMKLIFYHSQSLSQLHDSYYLVTWSFVKFQRVILFKFQNLPQNYRHILPRKTWFNYYHSQKYTIVQFYLLIVHKIFQNHTILAIIHKICHSRAWFILYLSW